MSKPESRDLADIGVFGGSGFYALLEGADEQEIETPYGDPSGPVTIGRIGGARVAFLPRHGTRHQFPPHRINYRANVWAMASLGVSRIIGPAASGSLQPGIAPGDFVLCDQFFDRTYGREQTFYDGPHTVHVSSAHPYCPELRQLTYDLCQARGITTHPRGTVVVIQGPRFSTRAESQSFGREGWEVINMTQFPEVVLATELELCYVNISLITDYDVGLEGRDDILPVSVESVIKVFNENNQRVKDVILDLIPRIPLDRNLPLRDEPEGRGGELMTLLVVGSLGLDTLETPFGRAENVLGGSASYFALAASFYTQVQLVAVAGDDFPDEHVELMAGKGIDLAGLERVVGPTFRWGGRYRYDLNERDTLFTDLGVFADFHPKLPPAYRQADHVFLANIHPQLQLEVLAQIEQPRFKALDSMNLWINTAREELANAISRVDLVTLNDGEARQFAGTHNLYAAARQLIEMGPRAVVIKKGEHGALLIWREGVFFAPAYPLEDVVDPTGAGDTFAGGFVGYLAQCGEMTPAAIKQAMIHGSVLASFCVEEFGPGRLARVTQDEINTRYEVFRELTHFEPLTGSAFRVPGSGSPL